MNEARLPLAGVTMTTLKEKDGGGSGGAVGGAKAGGVVAGGGGKLGGVVAGGGGGKPGGVVGGGSGKPGGAGVGGIGAKIAAPKRTPTIRIEVKLDGKKRDGENYEFCYPDLFKNAVKIIKITEASKIAEEAAASKTAEEAAASGPGVLKPMRDPDDPLAAGQDDAEAKQLADYFEKKYGGPTGKKKGRKRKFDFKDYGLGYDDTDPFVDNSEACDELLPNNLTTKMGGFYVNTGQLELREVSDHEGMDEDEGGSDGEDEDESSSSSSEMEDDDNDRGRVGGGKPSKKRRRPVIRDDDDDDDDEENVKSSTASSLNTSSKPRPNASSSSTTALLLAKKNKRLKMQQMSKRKKFLAAAGIEGSPLKGVKKAGENGDSGGVGVGGEKRKKTLTVFEMIQRKAAKDKAKAEKLAAGVDNAGNAGGEASKAEGAAIATSSAAAAATSSAAATTASSLMDNIIDAVIQEPFNEETKGKSSATATSASSGDSGPTSPAALTEVVVDMPADATDILKQVVEKLKALSATALSGCKGGEGKKKFFTPQVNELLLTVENECRSKTIRQGLRGRVYAHLAQHLPCNKDTLIKRARNLKTVSEAAPVDSVDMPILIKRLQSGVDAVMPDNIAKYKAECDKAAEAKGAAGVDPAAAAAGEGENGVEDKSGRKVYAPRKKFLWRRDMRENFFAIVKGKLKQFFDSPEGESVKSGGPGPETVAKVEEYLRHFLTEEIKNLWPKGWMNERVLLKESSALITDCLKEHSIYQGGDVLESLPMESQSLPVAVEQKLQQQPLKPENVPLPCVATSVKKDVGIDLTAPSRHTEALRKTNVEKTGVKIDSNQSSVKIDTEVGMDLTKPIGKTSDAEKAVQETLEFAVQQSQISHSARQQQQQSAASVRTSPPQPNISNVNLTQQVFGSTGASTASNSATASSAKPQAQVPGKGMIQADQLRQQQQQISQVVNSITSAMGMGLPALTHQQQALAQQQLEKLLNIPSSLPQLNMQQTMSAAVVTSNSTAASSVHAGRHPPNISGQAKPATTTTHSQHRPTFEPQVTPTITVSRTSTTSTVKTCPSAMPPPVSSSSPLIQPRSHCLPPGRANLPSVPLIQPNLSGKASSPAAHSMSQLTGNGGSTSAVVNQQQNPQQHRNVQPAHQLPQPRLSPNPPNIHSSVASTSPTKVVSSTSPIPMTHAGVSMNISPQKSPQNPSYASYPSPGGQVSPHRQPTPQLLHSSRTPSPHKTQSAMSIPGSHAGFLSQQVAQALTPPFGVFNSAGSSAGTRSAPALSSAPGLPASSVIPLGPVSGNSFSLPKAVDVLSSMPATSPNLRLATTSTTQMNGAFKPLVANGSAAVSAPQMGGSSLGNNDHMNLHKTPAVSVHQQKPQKQPSHTQQISSHAMQQQQQLNHPPQKQLLPGLSQQHVKQHLPNSANSGHHQYAPHSQNDATKLLSPGLSQRNTQHKQQTHNPQTQAPQSVPVQPKHANVTNQQLQQQQLIQMAQQQVLGQQTQQSLLQMQAATAAQQQQMLQQQQQLFQQQQQQTQLGYQPGQFKPH